MFSARGSSIFPHPASAWWIPVLLAAGWGPLSIADVIYRSHLRDATGFAMGWGMGIAFPFTILATLSIAIQPFRLLMYFLNRPKPLAK